MENANTAGTTEKSHAPETGKPIDQVIKEIRQNQDAIIKAVRLNLAISREASLAITSLERSRMFLGKTLGAYGNPNPYPTSYDPTSTVVEKTADVADFGYFAADLEGVLLIKYFRKAISDDVASPLKTLINECYRTIEVPSIKDPMWFFNYLGTAMMLSEEAAMWLGMMLQDYVPKSEVVFQSESETPTQQKVRVPEDWNGDLKMAGGFMGLKPAEINEAFDLERLLEFRKAFPEVMDQYCKENGYYFNEGKGIFCMWDEGDTDEKLTPSPASILGWMAHGKVSIGMK